MTMKVPSSAIDAVPSPFDFQLLTEECETHGVQYRCGMIGWSLPDTCPSGAACVKAWLDLRAWLGPSLILAITSHTHHTTYISFV